jgi:hypothetical protein
VTERRWSPGTGRSFQGGGRSEGDSGLKMAMRRHQNLRLGTAALRQQGKAGRPRGADGIGIGIRSTPDI